MAADGHPRDARRLRCAAAAAALPPTRRPHTRRQAWDPAASAGHVCRLRPPASRFGAARARAAPTDCALLRSRFGARCPCPVRGCNLLTASCKSSLPPKSPPLPRSPADQMRQSHATGESPSLSCRQCRRERSDASPTRCARRLVVPLVDDFPPAVSAATASP
jgi:hypothetical protein